MKTFKTGGIHPPESKFTENTPVELMPVPQELAISLNQHLGKPAKPVVKAGSEVKKGELIGEADGFISANVHASTSGKVKSVKPHPHPGGHYAMTIFITPEKVYALPGNPPRVGQPVHRIRCSALNHGTIRILPDL